MKERKEGMSRREHSGKRGWMRPELVLALGALLIAAVWLLGIGRESTAFEHMNNVGQQSGLELISPKHTAV